MKDENSSEVKRIFADEGWEAGKASAQRSFPESLAQPIGLQTDIHHAVHSGTAKSDRGDPPEPTHPG